jgi:hypothetical protein
LHGAVAHAHDASVAQRERAGLRDVSHSTLLSLVCDC